MDDSLKLAAQKALEAMTEVINEPDRFLDQRPARKAKVRDAITALRSALQHQEEREPASPSAVERAVFDEMQRIEPSWNRSGASRESAVRFALRAVANLQRIAGVVAATPPLLQKEEGPSLSAINDLAKVYASNYVSPHHITFTVEGLRTLFAAIATRQGEKP